MTKITDEQWTKLYEFLRHCPGIYAKQEAKCRLFVEGVHWVMRTGAQWRELPDSYGRWNSVYKRFARWSEHEVWERMHHHFTDDPDMENVLLDSSVIRAHPCAAGAPPKTVVNQHKPLVVVAADSVRKSMSLSMRSAIHCG